MESTDQLLSEFSDRQLETERVRRMEKRRAELDGLAESLRLSEIALQEAMKPGEDAVHEHMSKFYSAHEAAQALWAVGDQQHGYESGSFFSALYDLAFKADRENLVRLSWGFPRQMAAVFDYKYGGGQNALIEKAGG